MATNLFDQYALLPDAQEEAGKNTQPLRFHYSSSSPDGQNAAQGGTAVAGQGHSPSPIGVIVQALQDALQEAAANSPKSG